MSTVSYTHLDVYKRQALRYGLGGQPEMTQREVAELLGISQFYISRLEKRIIARLRGEMAKLQ